MFQGLDLKVQGLCLRFIIDVLGFRFEGLGFQGLGFEFQKNIGFRVYGQGLEFDVLGFRFEGLGFRVDV